MNTCFETLSGAAFLKMEAQEFAAISRDELVSLALRSSAILAKISAYIISTDETLYETLAETEVLTLKPQDIAALSKEELEQLVLKNRDLMANSPIKPGCRFFEALPEEYILHVLLEWLNIEDQALFDMALLNHMDRKAYLNLLQDTVHGGVLSVSSKEVGYDFNSGLAEWLESRNIFMRALKFSSNYDDDIPADFLARTGRQLLEIDLRECNVISDAEFGKLAARCPMLKNVSLRSCWYITDSALASLASFCPGLQALSVPFTKVTAEGIARLGESCRDLKKLSLVSLPIPDAGLRKIAKACPNVEELDLCTCQKITDSAIASLVEYCPRIHTLDVGWTHIADAGLARLGGGCRQLKRINISRCYLITDDGLGQLAEGCPMLADVNLGNCGYITYSAVVNLAQRCPQLRSLNIANTAVSDADKVKLREAYPAISIE